MSPCPIMLLQLFFILILCTLPSSFSTLLQNSSHPDPDSVAGDLLRHIALSTSNALSDPSQCLTGNPIDDCWLCSDWLADRYHLADCAIGFGRGAMGGKKGSIYTVIDPSDSNPENPTPGTLRHAAIQNEPLWIVFSKDMQITLKDELLVNSFKTIDGRGANVHIAGGACITIRDVSNVIIHGLFIHDCVPAGNEKIRSSPSEDSHHGQSDGDGISIHGSRDIWVDHCTLSRCTDGLIDVTLGSTAVTISNCYFSEHNKVMLLSHSDDYTQDKGMQVTVAFNRFGEKLVQRMPRCRHGYFHVVNNDYVEWGSYAVGGSANPTINSQGNRFRAPDDQNLKEVTKRINTDEKEWSSWNWRSDGDLMVNGAFFLQSGEGTLENYQKASSFDPLSSSTVAQLTRNAGVVGTSIQNNGGINTGGYIGGGYNGGGSVYHGNGGFGWGHSSGRKCTSPAVWFPLSAIFSVFLFLCSI